jgi:DNA-binding PadR family transcriptional regulator
MKNQTKMKNILELTGKIEPDPELKRFLEYYEKEKLSVIQLVAKAKTPALDKWQQYQHRRPTKKEIEDWFFQGGIFNVGIVCGQVSENLVVLDYEDKRTAYKIHGKDVGKDTFVVETSKGLHIYYKLPFPIRKFKIKELALDVQGEGSYVVAPPSIHPSGKQYEAQNFQNQPISRWKGQDFEEELYLLIQKAYPNFNPQEHRQAIDVEKILQGVKEGERNQACLWLATWFRRTGKKEEEALVEMQTWNNKLKTPMDDRELERTVQSAFKIEEPYKYWFKQNPDIEKHIEQYTPQEEKEAEKFLIAPTEEKMEFIQKALNEVVGETKTKTSLFLLELLNENVHVGGDSAAGKSRLCDEVTQCFPKNYIWKITGMTDKSLRYIKDAVGTLYIAEFAALSKGKKEEESTAQFDVKLLISEGKLTITVVEKNPETKKWETHIYDNDNVKNIITTSTDVDVTPELKNRLWELAVNETTEQTKAIKDRRAQEREGHIVDASKEKKVLRLATKKITQEKPKEFAIIPYASLIKDIVGDQLLRARRDINKLFNAVEAVATLNLRNRPRWNNRIVATPEDFWYAMQYMDEAIVGTFTEGTKRFWRVWSIIKQALDAQKRVDAESTIKLLKCNQANAYQWLKRLEHANLITKKEQPMRGRKAKVYYTKTVTTEKEQKTVIEMRTLFDYTKAWCFSNKNVLDTIPCFDKHTLLTEKIEIAILGDTIEKIVEELPEAPKEDEVEDSSTIWR